MTDQPLHAPFAPGKIPREYKSPSSIPPTVLLIEDDDAIRAMLARGLASAGYHVLQAPDGEKGLRLARSTSVDIVITDLVMPVQEGVETIMTLHRERPRLPIIAISGSVNHSKLYLAIAGKVGARRILSKPFAADVLIGLVEEVLAEADPTPSGAMTSGDREVARIQT